MLKSQKLLQESEPCRGGFRGHAGGAVASPFFEKNIAPLLEEGTLLGLSIIFIYKK